MAPAAVVSLYTRIFQFLPTQLHDELVLNASQFENLTMEYKYFLLSDISEDCRDSSVTQNKDRLPCPHN